MNAQRPVNGHETFTDSAVSWVWRLRIEGLTPGAKSVLVRLAFIVDEHFECSPSQREIAGDLGCSVRSVVRHLGELERLVLLSREYIPDLNGARYGTLYRLNPRAGSGAAASTVES